MSHGQRILERPHKKGALAVLADSNLERGEKLGGEPVFRCKERARKSEMEKVRALRRW